MLSVLNKPFMLCVIKLNVIMLSVIKLNVIILSVVMLDVTAPIKCYIIQVPLILHYCFDKLDFNCLSIFYRIVLVRSTSQFRKIYKMNTNL
jgi:hypothetical protein